MKSPEKAVAEPDALKILLGDSLPSDVNVQMKVLSSACNLQRKLITIVPTLLETSKSHISGHIFLTII